MILFQKRLMNVSNLFPFFQKYRYNGVLRAIKADSKIIGCIAAFFEKDVYRKNAEIAYWLNAGYRDKSIMSRTIKEFSEILFSTFDLQRIWARPFENNKASQRALEKAGFVCEGVLKQSVYKNGIFLNSIIYALIKS